MNPHEASTPEILEQVEVCLDALERGCPEEVQELLDGSAHAEAVRLRLRALLSSGLLEESLADAIACLPGGTVCANANDGLALPEQMGEFRLLQRLGQGGMGVVFLAEQESLGRRVAVKVVRPEHLPFARARERFHREAQAVAKLEHPGIVPIYAVGEEGGVPYFAMEYVEGESLDALLSRVRARRPTELTGGDLFGGGLPGDVSGLPPGSRRSWVDACLWLVAQVADALDHAHRQGVLHRDVKPSNLMLMASGRVRLLDFGLARADDAHAMTQPGMPIGSLPYMAPEQVRGDIADQDPRLDVYGLGVTLYELLCLRQAYDSPSGEGLRALILEGVPVPPQRHNSRVGWDAETVCLTAMELDPARRYQNAAAFASDLRRVLEREPIFAKRPGAWRRARRYAQRRPARATAFVLGIFIVVGGPLLYSFQSEFARRELQRAYQVVDGARAKAEASRAKAEASLDDAIGTVDAMVELAEGPELAKLQGGDFIRRELLSTALGLFEGLAEQHREDDRVSQRHADALFRAASAQQQLGGFVEAEAALHRVREITGTDPRTTLLRDRATLVLANVLRARGEFGAARTEVSTLFTHDAFAGDAMLQGQAYKLAAGLSIAEGAWQRAAKEIRAATAAFARINHSGADDDPRVLASRAAALQVSAYVEGAQLQQDNYADGLGQAAAIFRRLAELQPHRPSHRSNLITTLNSWAQLDSKRKRFDRAIACMADSVAEARALVAEFPQRHDYVASLLQARYQLSWLHGKTGASKQSEAALHLGVIESEQALRRHPDVRRVAHGAAVLFSQQARVLTERDALQEAEPLWKRSRDLWHSLIDVPEPMLSYVAHSGAFHNHWARFLLKAGRLPSARVTATKACELHRRAREVMGAQGFRESLTLSLLLRAEIEVALNDHDAALASIAEAVKDGHASPEKLDAEAFAPLSGRPELAALRVSAQERSSR